MNDKKLASAFNQADGLRLFDCGAHSCHVIDPRDPRSLALLATAYEKIYTPAFPNPADREPLAKWIRLMKDKKAATRMLIVIAGTDLDTDHPVIKGLSTAEYYPGYDVGQMAYNAIAPECRNEGLGRVMVDARKQALLEMAQASRGVLRGIFLDCKDPAKVKASEDSIDPAVRLKIFEKWGAQVMPVDFVLPPLHLGDAPCDKVKLLAYPHPVTGAYPDREALRDFITVTYLELADTSSCPPHNNPDYLKMMAQIDALPATAPKPPQSPDGPAFKG